MDEVVEEAFDEIFLRQLINQVTVFDRYSGLVGNRREEGLILKGIASSFACVAIDQAKVFRTGNDRYRDQRFILQVRERIQLFESIGIHLGRVTVLQRRAIAKGSLIEFP